MFTRHAIRAARAGARISGAPAARPGASGFSAGARAFATASAEASQARPYVAGAAAVGLAAAVALAAPAAKASEKKSDVKDVVAAITAIIDADESRGPLFVRLAWHASGTYDKSSGTGGSNGATMRFPPEADMGANAGLHIARALLEPVKEQFPDFSCADIWTLAGKTAVEVAGGPEIPWEAGRVDAAAAPSPDFDGRLPDADKGELAGTVQHVRDIFYRMGFNDREIVALLGAHALGRCHTDRSGYTGPWTRAETTFSNEYYRELLENTWTLKKWKGPTQFEDPTGDLMMLPSDMALIWDKPFLKVTQEYAKDSDVFFKDFASAFGKLLANGVSPKPWYQFW